MAHHIYISGKKLNFKELFNHYYSSQVMFAFKLVKSMEEAEDIVQEVFLNIWRSNSKFQNEIAFKSYLYRSTRNRCIDYFRQKKMEKSELDSITLSAEEVDHVVKNETYHLLYKAIQQLPPQTRNVIIKSMEGLTMQEVADSLNVSINTVKTLKKNAYKRLREYYGDAFILLAFLHIL